MSEIPVCRYLCTTSIMYYIFSAKTISSTSLANWSQKFHFSRWFHNSLPWRNLNIAIQIEAALSPTLIPWNYVEHFTHLGLRASIILFWSESQSVQPTIGLLFLYYHPAKVMILRQFVTNHTMFLRLTTVRLLCRRKCWPILTVHFTVMQL